MQLSQECHTTLLRYAIFNQCSDPTKDCTMSQTHAFATLRRTATLAAITLALGACASKPSPAHLAETVASNPTLSTFNTLVAQGGLSETLKSGGPFTVFAPTNEAFKAVPAATMADLSKHPEKLKEVLSYHVTPGKLMAADIKNSNAKSLNGANLALAKAGDFVTVESAAVVSADLGATNGVVHTIDTVLMPPKK
jgi:uncharacterized surface protein with fasciclin (FAS1) repeats